MKRCVRVMASRSLAVLPDHDAGVGKVHVRRHFEIDRRRNAFVNASCKIELGAVTGTIEPARPVAPEPALCARLQLLGGYAPEMGANADQNEILGFDGAHLVACI